MRRNAIPNISKYVSLLTLTVVLFGSADNAEAGGFLSRLLCGNKATARPVGKLRLFRIANANQCAETACPQTVACPPAAVCLTPPPMSGGCPKSLLMMVSDVDENGNTFCVYRVFFAQSCSNPATFIINLPCNYREATCINGECGENGDEGISWPLVEIKSLASGPGIPGGLGGPGPVVGNPGTNGVSATYDGVAYGLEPVGTGRTRQVIGVGAIPTQAGYFQYTDGLGNSKFYSLFRLSFVVGGETKEAGIGFQVDAVPPGGMMLPGRLSNVTDKTQRIDETDPSDPNKFVWTYVVHDNK